MSECLLTLSSRIRVSYGLFSSIDFGLQQRVVLQQADDLIPYKLIQVILPDRSVRAQRAFELTVSIGADTPIVVQPLSGCACRTPIQSIATPLTVQHPLQQRRLYRSTLCMMLVSSQLFLRRGKGLFTHQRRNGHGNPLRSRALVIRAISFRYAIPLTQRPCDALPRTQFGFSVAGRSLVRRIA